MVGKCAELPAHGKLMQSLKYLYRIGNGSSSSYTMGPIAAAAAELLCLDSDQIEYAAEMSIEHHLELTCDPVGGLVQIPCIERNDIAAMRALNAVNLARFFAQARKISFDMIVETMYET